MRMYFVIQNGEQSGPYSLDDLKTRKISSSTLLWHEGLTDWKLASEIPELTNILETPLPPPPPLKNIAYQNKLPIQKKSSYSRFLLLSISILILLFAGSIAYVSLIDPSGNSFIKVEINPPKPIIIAKTAGEDPNSSLLDYIQRVNCTVMNQGGKGKILVTCFFYQGNKKFEKSKQIVLTENEMRELYFTFEEVKILGSSNMRYEIVTRVVQ